MIEIVEKICEAIRPIAKDIMDAYEEAYAPTCPDCKEKAHLDRSKVDTEVLLDMAQCLVIDFKRDIENAELRKV